MVKEIAVCVNEAGHTVPLTEAGKVVVYRRERAVWAKQREHIVVLVPQQGLAGLRRSMAELLAVIGDCKIFAGLAVSGVPYFEFEKAGISVWEVEGRPENFLEDVWEQEEAAAASPLTVVKPSVESFIEEVRAGCYQVDLKRVQQTAASVTSKQVLLPLVRKGNFTCLTIICKHVPPWLEAELFTHKMVYQVKPLQHGELQVIITPTEC